MFTINLQEVRIMFAERLKQLRKENGMTQIELAEALDISKGTVAMWETGKRRPSFGMLDKLSELFDRRLDYIMGVSDDSSPAVKPGDDEVKVMGNWVVQEEYEDVMRKFTLLDDFGQKAVAAVLRAEFARCQEQSTLKSGRGVSVSVKIREVQDPIDEDLPD
jgi:transcriptional regulator with XRE-family HTH domain